MEKVLFDLYVCNYNIEPILKQEQNTLHLPWKQYRSMT